MKFERAETFASKVIAGFFIVFGVVNLGGSIAMAFKQLFDWSQTGHWSGETLGSALHLQTHPGGAVQLLLGILFAIPVFVLGAVVGAHFVRAGLWRWVEADLPDNSD